MPLLLLFKAFFIFCKSLKKVFALFNLFLSVCMHNLGEVFHETEICTHRISKATQLTKFRDKSYLITSFAVFNNEQRLVWIIDALIISSFVVLRVADLGALLVKSRFRTQTEVDSVHSVSFLIVLCNDCSTRKSILKFLLPVFLLFFSFFSQLVHVIEKRVRANNTKSYIYIEKSTLFFHDHACIKTWPNTDIVSI